jgi:hypothetical protein
MKKIVVVKKVKAKIRKIDPIKAVGDHLMGPTHCSAHRLASGVVIMILGVLISKISIGGIIVHLLVDVGGYGLHGIGLIPFADHMIDHYKKSGKL